MRMIDNNSLKTFLEHLAEQRSGKVYEEKGWAWLTCPFHNDERPSLRVSLHTGYFECLACGETGSIVKLWQGLAGVSKEEAIQHLKRLGVLKDVKPTQEAEYRYYDKRGFLLFRKLKLRHSNGSKTFRVEHYDFENDLWKAGKPENCPPALYNWGAVEKAKAEEPHVIFLVEGEKDVETLKALGLPATTAGGSNEWSEELAQEFEGLKVVLIPDNDVAGRKWLAKVGSSLINHAQAVFWIDLLEEAQRLELILEEKEDITDFIEKAKAKGLDPIEVIEEFSLKPFNLKELKEKAEQEALLKSGYFLTAEDLEKANSVEFLFEGFLPWGYLTILTSEAGEGKSWLSLGLVKEAIRRGVRAIYIDGDNPLPYVKENLEKFGLLEALKEGRLLYLNRQYKDFAISSENKAWKDIKGMLMDIEPCFIVVDTLGSLSRGYDPNNDRDMRDVISELKALRDKGHCVLLLHHIQKYAKREESMHAGLKYRGSAVIKTDADGLFYMERMPDGSYEIHAGKLRFAGASKLKITLKTAGVEIKADTTSKEEREALSLLEMLEAGQEYGKKDIYDIARYHFDWGRDKTDRLLMILKDKGLITEKGGRGKKTIRRADPQGSMKAHTNGAYSEEEDDEKELDFDF